MQPVNSWRERGKACLFALPVAVLIAFLCADPASAHTRLVETTPADGTQIAAAPNAVSLTFSGEVLKLGAAVKVSGPGGSTQMGAAKLKGKTVSWPVAGELANGKYNVSWRVTAADGHPIDGKFNFVLQVPKPTTATPTPTATPHTAEPQMTGPMDGMEGMPGMGARPTSATGSSESATTTGFAIAGLLLLTAIVTGAIVIERRRRPRPAAGPSEPSND